MANHTRTVSKNAAIGVALLSLSGSLLAVDVGATRAVMPQQGGLAPEPAQAMAVAAAAAAVASPARPACPLPASHGRPAGVPSRVAPHRSSPRVTLAALIVRVARPQARSRATPPPTVKRIAIREPRPAPTVRAVAAALPPRPAATAPARPAAARPSQAPALAAHAAAKPRRPGRSAVEAAQYFAVRTVEAQTPGLVHVAAVTRKRGLSRLVVHIIAKTHVGTLVEFEVLRRNGIGFAIESRTTRFVALSTRAKAAVRTSPAGHA